MDKEVNDSRSPAKDTLMRPQNCLLLIPLLMMSCSWSNDRSTSSQGGTTLPVCARSCFGNSTGDTAYYYSELIDSSDYYFFEISFAYGEDADPTCNTREVQVVTSKRSGALKSILVKGQRGHVYVSMDSCQVQRLETSY